MSTSGDEIRQNGTVLLMTRNWKYAILLSCKSAERRGTASEKRYLVSPVLAHTVRITVVLPGFPLRDQRAGRSQ